MCVFCVCARGCAGARARVCVRACVRASSVCFAYGLNVFCFLAVRMREYSKGVKACVYVCVCVYV